MRGAIENVRPSPYEGSYKFVSAKDTLHADDLVRETYCWRGSDYIDHDMFKLMNWSRVDHIMPAWVGRTIEELCKVLERPIDHYEVIRKV